MSGKPDRRAEMPAGSERVLETRSLRASHRRLAALLRPGMNVLDVGCGSGAITREIADAVRPGLAVGIDVSPQLIDAARIASSRQTNLHFDVADVHDYDRTGSFDIVTAARVLQWIPEPVPALEAMVSLVKPGGLVVVLDYDHTRAAWDPPLPIHARRFYGAFLAWRADAGMDNEIAKHLPGLFEEVGLRDVRITNEDEVAIRGMNGFGVAVDLWERVAATRGHQLVGDGFITERERAVAEHDFAEWARTHAKRQCLHLEAVTGVRPASVH
jgi:SAM-dependent methyltransferase